MQTYFPEASNFHDLTRIALLIATAIYFSAAIYRGKFVWFLDANFSIARLLLIMAVVALILAAISPAVRWILQGESTRYVVRVELDHIAIRDAARLFLLADNSVTNLNVDASQIPGVIAHTAPTLLEIRDGCLKIEYGGEFGHFGLVIAPMGEPVPYGELLADGIAYYEGD